MFKLTARGDYQRAAWYFEKKADVEKFKYVFANHGCNIDWKEEEKDNFEEMDSDDFAFMRKDPEKRAENNLCWVFNSYLKDNHQADKSARLAENIMKQIME